MFKVISSFISQIPEIARTGHPILQFFQRFLRYFPVGLLAFELSSLIKEVALLIGKTKSERAIEHPWVLKQLNTLPRGSRVLDVGCCESLLSFKLVAMGFQVVGLDIREYPFKNKRMLFVRRDARCTAFPSNFFDAIVLVSTIEHIGVGIDKDADLKTMKELNRVLKPKGIIIITTPYLNSRSLQVTSSGRIYNRIRLKELTKNFQVLKEEYFCPQHVNTRIIWTKIDKKWIDKLLPRGRICIACLTLQKL